MSVRIYGASDDLLEIEGDVKGEFGVDCDEESHIACSDGTLLGLYYDNHGLWRITLKVRGSAAFSKIEGSAAEDTCDVVTLEGDIRWVVVGRGAGSATGNFRRKQALMVFRGAGGEWNMDEMLPQRPVRTMAPVQWFGGKAKLTGWILPLLPQGATYVEPFCGAASLLWARFRTGVEVLNDIDDNIVNLFRVLQDPKAFQEFAHRITWTLYSRAELVRAIGLRNSACPVERAWSFFLRVNQGFSGEPATSPGSWSVTKTGRLGDLATSRWSSRLGCLEWWHSRLQRVFVEHTDALECIRRWDTPGTVFYCDPPYVLGTRTGGVYTHECSDDFHRDLVSALLSIQGAAALSGYESDIYAPFAAAGWTVHRRKTSAFAAGRDRRYGMTGSGAATRKAARTECLWVSPGAGQLALL